jgi:hypothetical protein
MSICPILSCPRTEPQEPRRPRFSFFHLHNVKELTSASSRTKRRQGSRPRNPSENITPHPVARRSVRPVRKTSTVGARSSTSSTWLDVVDTPKSVNTQFQISTPSKLKTRKLKSLRTPYPFSTNFLATSEACRSSAPSPAPRLQR